MKKKISSMIAGIGIFTCLFTVPVQAKENMVPNYELKFLLDSSQILDEDHKLTEEFQEYFYTGNTYKTIGVEYIETSEYDFSNAGWTNRIRIKENGENFELTYKKRYTIENGDINTALTKANEEGFDISDTNYEAQVDWGYEKMTLSISNNKKASNSGYDEMELPGKKNAIKIIKDNMPGKEKNWYEEKWGEECIEAGKKCGPVYYSKYQGEISGIAVDIEVWPLYTETTDSTEYITELSFKEDTYDEAFMNRENVMEELEQKGILLHEDSLKTQKILKAYLN